MIRAVKHCIRGISTLRVRDEGRPWSFSYKLLLVLLLPVAVIAWSYWPEMVQLFDIWQINDDYSVGQLVPIIAIFLLWRERKLLGKCHLAPCWWAGIALLLLAQAARMYATLTYRYTPRWYALLLTVAGLVLVVAGKQVFRRVLWIMLFLFLMVPLPREIHNLIAGPLQNVATTGSVFVLEAFGAAISQEGNVVILNETTRMAVAEACSGLRMLTAFVIVAAFVAYVVKRPRWQKAVLLFSSIPVAVACNIVRLCVTAALFMLVSTEVGQKFFHDFAGLVMMPIAALLLFAELRLMDMLIVPEADSQQEWASDCRGSAAGTSGKQIKREKECT